MLLIALLVRADAISLLLIAFRVIIDRINSAINRTVGFCTRHYSSIHSVFILHLANAIDSV